MTTKRQVTSTPERGLQKRSKNLKTLGETVEVASSKDQNFNYIPKGYDLDSDLKYLHITSNNTVAGTQFKDLPDTKIPLVADMSSEIFSRKLDINRFAMVYAGAQKNMGPAGTVLVIVRKDLLGKVSRTLPTMLDYRTHIEKGSSFNTPPGFSYLCEYAHFTLGKRTGRSTGYGKNECCKS